MSNGEILVVPMTTRSSTNSSSSSSSGSSSGGGSCASLDQKGVEQTTVEGHARLPSPSRVGRVLAQMPKQLPTHMLVLQRCDAILPSHFREQCLHLVTLCSAGGICPDQPEHLGQCRNVILRAGEQRRWVNLSVNQKVLEQRLDQHDWLRLCGGSCGGSLKPVC